MIPKRKRLRDRAAIHDARKEYSELSGLPIRKGDGGPHHIISVGSGGPDHRLNLIQLTKIEHIQAHSGQISKDMLWRIVAEREGMTVEEVESVVREMKA